MVELVILGFCGFCAFCYICSILDEDVWEMLCFLIAASVFTYFLGEMFFDRATILQIDFLLLVVVVSLRYLHHKRILLEENLEQFLKYAISERDNLALELILILKLETKLSEFDMVKGYVREKDYDGALKLLGSLAVDDKIELSEISLLINLLSIGLEIKPSTLKKTTASKIIEIFEFCRKKIRDHHSTGEVVRKMMEKYK